MLQSSTFASAFERERWSISDETKTFEKSSENVWKLKQKVIIFAPTFAKRKRDKFFERFTYQQVVQETYSIIRNIPSKTTINNEILSKGI